jgi:hypothetical protein
MHSVIHMNCCVERQLDVIKGTPLEAAPTIDIRRVRQGCLEHIEEGGIRLRQGRRS